MSEIFFSKPILMQIYSSLRYNLHCYSNDQTLDRSFARDKRHLYCYHGILATIQGSFPVFLKDQ